MPEPLLPAGLATFEIVDFVQKLGLRLPEVEQFWRLGDLTGLRHDSPGRFYRANYERGILLYALVAAHRPEAVLEFGTGRGYGSLCMAWAMEDGGIPGRIYTIDRFAQADEISWPIDWGNGPRVERLSRSRVWPQAAPASWLERIESLTGFAGQVMARWRGPRINLAFIDGGHDHPAVRHDFYSVLEVAAPGCGILFDDYNAPFPDFGVKRIVDEEVLPYLGSSLIYTDRRWPGGESASLPNPEYGMVWVADLATTGELNDLLPPARRRAVLESFRRREAWQSRCWYWKRRLSRLLKKA